MTLNDPKVSELTVSQLQQLIRSTVQEAVTEVIIEINARVEAEELIQIEAEMNEFIRAGMRGMTTFDALNSPLDD